MVDYILTLDPGGTTGWAYGRFHATGPYECLDHGMIPDGIDGFIQWWRESGYECDNPDLVVSESFQLRGVVNPDITPLRIEGALSVLRPGVIYQPPAAKMHAKDAVLRRYGLWWPGAGHDRDAARHALAYLKLQNHTPTMEKMGLTSQDEYRLCELCYTKNYKDGWCRNCGH